MLLRWSNQHDRTEARAALLENPKRPIVACLCAEWCGTCRGYSEIFSAAQLAHTDAVFLWFDVEADAEALGDIDVEDFPTLVIEVGGEQRFAGTITPQAGVLARVLQNALDQANSLAEPQPEHALHLAKLILGS